MTADGVRRRTILRSAGAGTVSALAGCITFGGDDHTNEPPPFGPPDTDWPMAGYDARNTGFSPEASGPTSEPEIEWEYRFEEDATPGFALADTALAVVADDTLHRFDLEAGDSWTIDGNRSGPPAIDADTGLVFAAVEEGRFSAFDLADGTERWHVPLAGDSNPPVVHDGTVYVGDDDGTVAAFGAVDGAERWRTSVGGESLERVAADGEHVVTSTRVGIVGLDAADGDERWRVERNYYYAPVLADGTVYVTRKALRAFDATGGTERWVYDPQPRTTASPGFVEEAIYLGRAAGYLDTIDTDRGERKWTANERFGDEVTTVVSDGEAVYVGSWARGGGGVAAIDADDGTTRWRVWIANNQSVDALAVVGNRVLVGMSGGTLLSLTEP